MSHVNNGFKGYQYYEFNYIKVTLIGRVEITEMVFLTNFPEGPGRTWERGSGRRGGEEEEFQTRRGLFPKRWERGRGEEGRSLSLQ